MIDNNRCIEEPGIARAHLIETAAMQENSVTARPISKQVGQWSRNRFSAISIAFLGSEVGPDFRQCNQSRASACRLVYESQRSFNVRCLVLARIHLHRGNAE